MQAPQTSNQYQTIQHKVTFVLCFSPASLSAIMIIICPRFCLSTHQEGGVENNFGLEIAYTLGSTTTIPGDIYIVNNWLNVPSY